MRLKELRLKNKLTQKELANKLNVTNQTILNWENGIFEPSINDLIKLADIFDVSLDYLLERDYKNNLSDVIYSELKNVKSEDLAKFIKNYIDNKK